MKIIDIRSDTFTIPTPEMRLAIAEAPLGDDVFGEDPSVNELERFTAEFLGKEASIYVPSGVMANQIGLAVQTNPGDEFIVEADAHIFYYEAAAPAIISRIQPKIIKSQYGAMDLDEIEAAIRPKDVHFPPTRLVCVENTHNRHGGRILPIDYISDLSELTKKQGLALHCDGARIWEAAAETEIHPKEYAKYFDSIAVCLSKGLGAPVGSLLVSSRENIEKARRWRKVLGGGMRQAGIIASAGLFALKNHFSRLKRTHEDARTFASIVEKSEFASINSKIDTNIVVIRTKKEIDAQKLIESVGKKGVKALALGKDFIRCVFHFQISTEEAIKAAEIFFEELKNSKNQIES